MRRRLRCRARRGFTLVEVLVASLVLLAGLVSVASATALALRALAAARIEHDAALRAARRFERLRGVPCPMRAGGIETNGGLVERWTVAPHAGGAATRIEVVVAPVARPTAERSFVTLASC